MRLATKTALITGGNSGIGLRRTSPDGHGRVHTASGGSSATETGPQAGHPPRPLGAEAQQSQGHE